MLIPPAHEGSESPSLPHGEGPAATGGAPPVTFDFRRPNKFSREHVRALQIVHETFARQMGTMLSTTLRTASQVSLRLVDQLSYDEYVSSSPNPSLLAIISLEPLSGAGIMQVPLPLAMSMLDRLLGGKGEGPYPSRPLTNLEEGILREILDRSLAELASAFGSLVSFEPAIVQLESNPQFAQIAAPSDMVVSITFDLRFGGSVEEMSVCVPFASLQPALERITGHSLLNDRSPTDRAASAQAMATAVADIPVSVAARFPDVILTSGEIAGLRPGDLVPLGVSTDRPLDLCVADVTYLPVVVGRRIKRLACRVVDPSPLGAP